MLDSYLCFLQSAVTLSVKTSTSPSNNFSSHTTSSQTTTQYQHNKLFFKPYHVYPAIKLCSRVQLVTLHTVSKL